MKYTQQTMEEALGRVKLMQANLGGTEILAPLQNIYRGPSIPGHPLQVRSGTELTEETANVKSLRSVPLSFMQCVEIWFVIHSLLSYSK